MAMTVTKTYIPLNKGIDLSMRKLPLIKIESDKKGPKIWLSAAIHGDEVTGTALIHSLLSKLQTYPLLNGAIYAFPILNPAGFETMSRREAVDESDLNRLFPGDLHGTSAERHASIIVNAILATKPDYLIDLHTDSFNSIAYAIVDQVEQSAITTEKAVALVETLGFPWAFDREWPDYDPKKTLTGYLMTQNIPSVTIELGGPMVVDEYFRKKGLDALWKFLQALGMAPAKSEVKLQAGLPRITYVFEERLQCDATGIIDYRVKPGEKFRAGDVLGKIRNVYGKEIEMVTAPTDGILFSHEDQSIAFPGQTLFTYVKPAIADIME